MSTWYGISSSFRVKPDVARVVVEARIGQAFEFLGGLDTERLEIREADGRLTVGMDHADSMSYSTACNLDKQWTKLAKDFADFADGPVEVTSSGDDYENGPLTWRIGPAKAVLRAELKEIEGQLSDLRKRRAAIRKRVRKAGDKIIVTNPDDERSAAP